MNYTFWIAVAFSVIALIWNFWQQKRIEELKRDNEKATLVHRVQFEKEFKIYNDLWGKLIELRDLAKSLRPHLDSYNDAQTFEEIAKERLTKLQDAYNACKVSYEQNKPFYSNEVYLAVEKAIQTAHKEAVEYRFEDRNTREYWNNADKNIQELNDALDVTCDIIRKRIGILNIEK